MEAWLVQHLLSSGVDIGLVGFLVYLVRDVNRVAAKVEAEAKAAAERHEEIIRDLHRIDKKTAVTIARVNRLEGVRTRRSEENDDTGG